MSLLTTILVDSEVPSLVGIDTRTAYRLVNFATFLGRSIECDIVLSSDMSLSRRHACILKIEGVYYLRDLQSSNGTLLNGLLVNGMVPIKQNDEIYFGRCRYLFNPTIQKLHDTPPFCVANSSALPASPWLQPNAFLQHFRTQVRKLLKGIKKQNYGLPSRESVLTRLQG